MDSTQADSAFVGSGQRDLMRRTHERLDELKAAHKQMEQLQRFTAEITSNRDLDATLHDATLHRVITAAMELTDAQYAALGICGHDGKPESFLCDGIDADTVRRLASLSCRDVSQIDDVSALRRDAAVEFDPALHALLVVPITLRDEVFGNLYLGDGRPGRVFTDTDEVAARVLVSAAAVAIENARLFRRENAAAQWITASREIMAALQSGGQKMKPLQVIVDRALQLADAEQAILLVPAEAEVTVEDVDSLVVAATAGRYASQVVGRRVPVDASTTGSVARHRTAVITDSFQYPIEGFTDVGDRSAIVIPLCLEDTVLGVLAVARSAQQPPFDEDYLGLVTDFANHAAIALALAVGREHAREVAVLADRERIAHDLHDHVIQKLFAAGLDLQGTIARTHTPEIVVRLTRTVDDLQETIEDIRATIFQLQNSVWEDDNFRQRIQNRVAELTEDRGLTVTLDISGALTNVTGELADHADAVVSEAVSNAVRHARATRLTVRICVDHRLSIDIIDDGYGIPQRNLRHSGLANLARRAEQVQGRCAITAAPGGGTWVSWAAPLAPTGTASRFTESTASTWTGQRPEVLEDQRLWLRAPSSGTVEEAPRMQSER